VVHPHRRADELQTTVFDDTMMSAVKDLLRSENGESIDAALKLFLMATNHGRYIDFRSW
jgi:hypothetical protein